HAGGVIQGKGKSSFTADKGASAKHRGQWRAITQAQRNSAGCCAHDVGQLFKGATQAQALTFLVRYPLTDAAGQPMRRHVSPGTRCFVVVERAVFDQVATALSIRRQAKS